MTKFVVDVPPDAEALLVQHLRARGYDAQSELPISNPDAEHSIDPGSVRVTRTGGDLRSASHEVQDSAQVLIETWDVHAVAAWDRIVRVWAELRIVQEQGSDLSGSMIYDLDLQVPRLLDDDRAPELHHYQFLVTALLPLTTIVLESTDG